ncbi:MAG: hypothetical protein GXO87_12405 [Chlorobi bacterium]|nr:hypothetical protein [Chlorobiota bacterium]
MSSVSETEKKRKELEEAFAACHLKIEEFLKSLKQYSSEEVLNGSIENAQKILNEILPIENESKKLMDSENKFIQMISNFKFNSAVGEDSKTGMKDEISFTGDSKNGLDKSAPARKNYRMQILKALIYLGGSARVDEVLGFIERDMKGKFSSDDLKPFNDDETVWQHSVKKEREDMLKEGLLSAESSNGTWEIVQKGIDFLSKHGK